MLTANTTPTGNLAFYSALLFPGETPAVYFNQKDILSKDSFIYLATGDPIKSHLNQAFPAGGWQDDAFKSLFNSLLSTYPEITCDTLAEVGVSFLFGYTFNGNLSEFQGALFTFSTTPSGIN